MRSAITNFDFLSGTSVEYIARVLVTNAPSISIVNGVQITAQKGSTVNELLLNYYSQNSKDKVYI